MVFTNTGTFTVLTKTKTWSRYDSPWFRIFLLCLDLVVGTPMPSRNYYIQRSLQRSSLIRFQKYIGNSCRPKMYLDKIFYFLYIIKISLISFPKGHAQTTSAKMGVRDWSKTYAGVTKKPMNVLRTFADFLPCFSILYSIQQKWKWTRGTNTEIMGKWQ